MFCAIINKIREWPRTIPCPARSQLQSKSKTTKAASFSFFLPRPLPPPSSPPPLTKHKPLHDEIHERFCRSPPLRFSRPCRASTTCRSGCLGPQDLSTNRNDYMASWGNVRHRVGSQPETRECHEPRWDSLPVKERHS